MGAAWRFSFDPVEFAGKRVLVTGGTEGMGEAIVRRLTDGGATVATTARSPLPEGGSVGLFVQADISTRQGTDKVVDQVVMNQVRKVLVAVVNIGDALTRRQHCGGESSGEMAHRAGRPDEGFQLVRRASR